MDEGIETSAIALDSKSTPASSSSAPPPVISATQEGEEDTGPKRDSRYPQTVPYCPSCTLPAELHEYNSKNQFEKYVPNPICFRTPIHPSIHNNNLTRDDNNNQQKM